MLNVSPLYLIHKHCRICLVLNTCWSPPNCHFAYHCCRKSNVRNAVGIFHKGTFKVNFEFLSKMFTCVHYMQLFLHTWLLTWATHHGARKLIETGSWIITAGSNVVGGEQVLRCSLRAAVMYHGYKLTDWEKSKSREPMETDPFGEISMQSTMEESRNPP